MAVTRLKRKARRNKVKAKHRVDLIKRLSSKNTVKSPNKEESGIIIGNISEILGAEPKKETNSENNSSSENISEE